MKKLIVLIVLLLTSLSSFSQTDTTKVQIKTPVAKLVIKDILKGDGCAQELKLTQDKVIKLEARETQKDTIISLLESKDKNNQFIINTQKDQLQLSKELSEQLHKELKGQRTKTFLWKVGTFAGILTTSYLLVK
jgi:phosphotransferase system IIB component